MTREGFIERIQGKLCRNEQLEPFEIRAIIAALRESTNCLQTPYYEVIYHDELDQTEYRIMEPVHHDERPLPGSLDYIETRDRFELNFNRIVDRRKISKE